MTGGKIPYLGNQTNEGVMNHFSWYLKWFPENLFLSKTILSLGVALKRTSLRRGGFA